MWTSYQLQYLSKVDVLLSLSSAVERITNSRDVALLRELISKITTIEKEIKSTEDSPTPTAGNTSEPPKDPLYKVPYILVSDCEGSDGSAISIQLLETRRIFIAHQRPIIYFGSNML